MKIALKTESWHHWLACITANRWDIDHDICGYTRQVICGALTLLLAIGVLLTLAASTGDMIRWLLGLEDYMTVGVIMWFILTASSFIAALFGVAWIGAQGIICYQENSYRRKPGFIRHAWRAFRDKACVRIDWQ